MIENLLKKHKIKKNEFGKELGYTTPQGIYKALKNDKQRPLIYAYLLKKLLEKKGIKLEKLLESL